MLISADIFILIVLTAVNSLETGEQKAIDREANLKQL